MATLNPIEMEGTYPLPEAQLDRFLFKVRLNYPDEGELARIISSTTGPEEAGIEPVFHADEAAATSRGVEAAGARSDGGAGDGAVCGAHGARDAAAEFALRRPTRRRAVHDEMVNRYVSFGSSPRGAQALILGAKVRALLDGRANIAREDIDQRRGRRAGPSHHAQLRRAFRRNRRRAHRRAGHQVGSRRAQSEVSDDARGARVRARISAQARRLVLGIKRARTVRAGQRALGPHAGTRHRARKFQGIRAPATICASSTGTPSRASTI